MLKIATKTRLIPEEAIKQAIEFFGPGGYGLKVAEQSDSCAYFEGGGGRIEVATCTDDKGTSVDLETREWEYQGQSGKQQLKTLDNHFRLLSDVLAK